MISEKRREYNRQYSLANKEKLLKHYKADYQKNREKKCKQFRDRYYANHDKHLKKGRKYYRKHKDECLKRTVKFALDNPLAIKICNYKNKLMHDLWIYNYKSDKVCADCGNTDSRTFHFHHIDPSTKSFAVSDMVKTRRPNDLIEKEIAKCIILCANCHMIRHRGNEEESLDKRIDKLKMLQEQYDREYPNHQTGEHYNENTEDRRVARDTRL